MTRKFCLTLISQKEFSASRELIRQKRLMSRQASRSGAHDSSHRKHSDASRSPRLASKIPEPVGLPRTRKTSREPSKSPQRENQATDEETPKSPQRKSTVAILRHAGEFKHTSTFEVAKSLYGQRGTCLYCTIGTRLRHCRLMYHSASCKAGLCSQSC